MAPELIDTAAAVTLFAAPWSRAPEVMLSVPFTVTPLVNVTIAEVGEIVRLFTVAGRPFPVDCAAEAV